MSRATLLPLLLCVAFAAADVRATEPAPLRVLFVGNSLTYVNDLPATLARIGAAQAQPVSIETRTFVAPGGTLEERWADGVARAALMDGHWDALVLQERGGVAACLAAVETRNGRDCRAMVTAHRAFARAAAGHADRVLLLETWSMSEDGQYAVDVGMRALARSTAARIVHCGDALGVLARRQGRAATFPDGVHPSPIATALMAAQLFDALTGTPPTTLPPVLAWQAIDAPRPAQPSKCSAKASRGRCSWTHPTQPKCCGSRVAIAEAVPGSGRSRRGRNRPRHHPCRP